MAKLEQYQRSSITLDAAILRAQESVMSRLNCHNIGKILEFDAGTQRCTIQLMQIKQFRHRYITPPLLTDVPLIILGAGNAHITMPDPVGTICLLLFMDRNIDAFLETGELYAPDTTRMHDFTDCVALTTFTTLANPMVDYDTEAITLIHQKIIEEVKKQSYIKIYPDRIELKNIQGEAAQGSISVGEKINIGNNTQNLADLIQAFLTACENISVTPNTGVITPAAKQAFTDLKTQFEELLQ